MKITNKYNLPESFARALAHDGYDYDPEAISATGLIKAPRQRILEKRHWDELEQDVTDRVWALLGSAVHYMLDKASGHNSLNEERLAVDFDGTKIVGKPDLLEGNTLYDYKITSVWKYVYGISDDWEKQLNIYNYLYKSYGFDVKDLQIVAVFRDFSQNKAHEDNYPSIPLNVFRIKMWASEDILAYISDRIDLHKEAEKLADDELPFCTDEERWKQPTKYAVMKNNNKRAVKLYDNEADAIEHAKTDKAFWIQERPGIAKRCEKYCPVKDFCNQYKEADDV